jgi:hypothetical protein
MSNTLLIWEEVPETTKLYVIPNQVADEYRPHFDDAHNHMINQQGWENNNGLLFLNTALSDAPDGIAEKGFEQYLGIFAKYKVSIDSPLKDQNITAVYHSGFLL